MISAGHMQLCILVIYADYTFVRGSLLLYFTSMIPVIVYPVILDLLTPSYHAVGQWLLCCFSPAILNATSCFLRLMHHGEQEGQCMYDGL